MEEDFNEDCWFCKDYGKGRETIFLESENFYVVPSLGTIVEGYSLILPKKHMINVGAIPEDLFGEFENLKEKTQQLLSTYYCPPIFFEHGPVSCFQRGGCCIDHAHLHAVPLKQDILEDILKNFNAKEIKSMQDLRKNNEMKMSYLYYENQQGKKYIIDLVAPISSQYIRQLIAVKIGKPEEWDWRDHPNMDNFNRTVERLKPKR